MFTQRTEEMLRPQVVAAAERESQDKAVQHFPKEC